MKTFMWNVITWKWRHGGIGWGNGGKNSNIEYTAICTPFSVKALSLVCNLKSIIICDSIHGVYGRRGGGGKNFDRRKIKKLYGCCCAFTEEKEKNQIGCARVWEQRNRKCFIQLGTILCFNSFPQIPSMFPAWMVFRDPSKNRIWLTAWLFSPFCSFFPSASFFRLNVWLL